MVKTTISVHPNGLRPKEAGKAWYSRHIKASISNKPALLVVAWIFILEGRVPEEEAEDEVGRHPEGSEDHGRQEAKK